MTYTEDALIEQPAIALFSEMGWEVLNCFDEEFGADGTLGRDNRGEVILLRYLRSALETINPQATALEIQSTIDVITRDRSAMSAIAANEESYKLLREGVKVKVKADRDDEEDTVTVKVIDWNQVDNNHFLLCSQLFITGEIETRRPDLIGFVNGLPLVFVELKASHKQLIHAYKHNLKDYRDTIPHLFSFNQLIILSNGVQSRVGTLSSQWEHFTEWKKIESEDEARKVSLEVVLRGTCERSRLLDLVENFILFETKQETVKIIAMYHQYLGVNQVLEGLKRIEDLQGQLGVFWHTQGSGKSFSMVFLCQKAFRKLPGNWTFVLVTDRTDLDGQIYKTFNNTGMINQECQAESAAELQQLLSEDHRFVFTLIQKFRVDIDEDYPLLSERNDVIVITDEAHRSQYGNFAGNMRRALPNAGFIAFTGTPLMDDDEKTREVFGDYVSIYNFADAVDDGATLPLYYENRVPEMDLLHSDLGDQIAGIIDNAELNEESEVRLEREFGRAYHIITRDDRLDTIAEDLVTHFMGREPFSTGVRGKAMVVSIDKATAIRMYDKVLRQWQLKLTDFQQQLTTTTGSALEKLKDDIAYMETTDMAVVVSGGQGDYEAMEKKGLDYKTHRERQLREDLDDKFKEEADPLRIVFVCAMWLTGFDAPCVSTLYLDKPLKKHTLMQTIARANRVHPGKVCGQIVDYINIFGALQHALGIYGSTGGDKVEEGFVDNPAQDKEALRAELERAVFATGRWLAQNGVDLDKIIGATAASFEKLQLLDAASELMLKPDLTAEFVGRVRQINRLFKAVMPDTRALEFIKQRVAVNVIYAQLRHKSGLEIDDSEVMDVVRQQVNELLDESIETIYIGSHLPDPVDISKIDFDALAEMVNRITKPRISDAEKLKNLIELKIGPMLERNHLRQNLQEKFQAMIDEYNNGAHNAEQFFAELRKFIAELNTEERRGVREGLDEEELAIFDLLSDGLELSEKERGQVKAIAKALLEKIRDDLVIDWRKKQQAKARVRQHIQQVLDNLPASYDADKWNYTFEAVYQHVYQAYRGRGGE
ncbi:MAG: type I restriction endonuclease subunit R [Proteobacteria bacterium]|nr:type I restriction endonuclease subunit R [Pseudomonadota bacterium]